MFYDDYVQNSVIYLIHFLLIYTIGSVAVYLLLQTKKCTVKGSMLDGNRVMFVISHPDDECMFFGPAIIKFTKQNNADVFLLCLSNGDYYHQGNVRKQELLNSCSVLGIPASNIKVSTLPDHPKERWNESIVANIIIEHVKRLHIDTLCTFDKGGVSYHANHISVYYGVVKAYIEDSIPKYCKIYCLDTVNIYRKYSVVLDILCTVCCSSNWILSSVKEFLILKMAMAAHQSQYVWFRKLYIHFSRYVFINSYTLLTKDDVELDLLIPITD